MAAGLMYRFNYIAPNSSATLFLHGWGLREAVNFSIVAYAGSGNGVLYPVGHATLVEGETKMHVNGTQGRFLHVRNNAPFNSVTVDILAQWESF